MSDDGEYLKAWVKEKMAIINANPTWRAQSWAGVFLCGYDRFNGLDLREPSLSWNDYLKLLHREAEKAWKESGSIFLAELFHPADPDWKCWAHHQFGDPPRR